jgi:hypothetical protein
MTLKYVAMAAASGMIAGAVIGVGAAGAQPNSNDNQTPITGDALTKATQAALAFTGGGTVTETEAGDEESYYQVEVTMADGRQIDVNLDSYFKVVGSKAEPPDMQAEPDDDAD